LLDRELQQTNWRLYPDRLLRGRGADVKQPAAPRDATPSSSKLNVSMATAGLAHVYPPRRQPGRTSVSASLHAYAATAALLEIHESMPVTGNGNPTVDTPVAAEDDPWAPEEDVISIPEPPAGYSRRLNPQLGGSTRGSTRGRRLAYDVHAVGAVGEGGGATGPVAAVKRPRKRGSGSSASTVRPLDVTASYQAGSLWREGHSGMQRGRCSFQLLARS
jgi:hypothetical protein